MAGSNGTIRFHELMKVTLNNRTRLKEFLKRLMTREGKDLVSVDFIFCSDKYLLRINKQYLDHDDLTDIITFDLSDTRNALTSEIYISVERVKENAALYDSTFQRELHRVIFHGILHLCDYGDKNSEEKLVMRGKEEEYLKKYFDRGERST
jgi:rRNA maturation RNase YbeY